MQLYLCIPIIAYFICKSRNITKNIIFIFLFGLIVRGLFYTVTEYQYGIPIYLIYMDLFTVGILLSYLYSKGQLVKLSNKLKPAIQVLTVFVLVILGVYSNLKYGYDFVMFVVIPLFAIVSFFIFTLLLEKKEY